MIFDISAAEKCLEELKREKEMLDKCMREIESVIKVLSSLPESNYNDIIIELSGLNVSFKERIEAFQSMTTALEMVSAIYERSEKASFSKSDPKSKNKSRSVQMIHLTDHVPADISCLLKCQHPCLEEI